MINQCTTRMECHIEQRVAGSSAVATLVLVAHAANTAAAAACLNINELFNENENNVATDRVVKSKVGNQWKNQHAANEFLRLKKGTLKKTHQDRVLLSLKREKTTWCCRAFHMSFCQRMHSTRVCVLIKSGEDQDKYHFPKKKHMKWEAGQSFRTSICSWWCDCETCKYY